MQYMILIYAANAASPVYGTPAFEAMMSGYFAVTAEMKAAGVYKSGDGLQDTHTATSLRIRDGKTETMDGPFAETKETLGGYYLIDVADLDAALLWAGKIPTAQYGTVEVRPISVY